MGALAHGRDAGELDGGPEPGTRAEAEFALYPDHRRATGVHTGPSEAAPAPPGSSVVGALDAHAAGPVVADLDASLVGLLSGPPEVVRLAPVAIGDLQRGAIPAPR